MAEIKIERNPTDQQLKDAGVFEWPIWEKEKSEFPWSYDEAETCFFLEGRVIVTPDGGKPTEMGKGDLVTFPKGMSCRWNILEDVRKHYTFG